MLFTKDSKIVKISAFGEGYYSGAKAYGEIYLPYEFFEKHEDILKTLYICVGELDGKHSEVECDVEFDTLMVEDILKFENDSDEYDRNLNETISNRIGNLLDMSYSESRIFYNFSSELLKLEKINTSNENIVTLTTDTVIENVIVPKGSLVTYTIFSKKPISDDWTWEINFEM